MPNKSNGKSVNSKQFRESPWHISSFVREIDQFGSPIPAFNIKGSEKVKTTFGGILSATIVVLTLGYFVQNMQGLVKGDDPIINYVTISDYYDDDQSGLNLFDANQRFAIQISNVNELQILDPQYVTLNATVIAKDKDDNRVELE